jgi:hypothetical protein
VPPGCGDIGLYQTQIWEGRAVKTTVVVLMALCLLVVCPYIVLAKVVPQGSAAGMTADESGDYAALQSDAPDLGHLAAGGDTHWGEILLGVVLVVAVIAAAALIMSS